MRRGCATLAVNLTDSSALSSLRSASSGERSLNLPSSVQSTRWRLECGRQLRLGPLTRAANSRSSILVRIRFVPEAIRANLPQDDREQHCNPAARSVRAMTWHFPLLASRLVLQYTSAPQ